jgi:outer membrane murein-binding lipoprotein Lpp
MKVIQEYVRRMSSKIKTLQAEVANSHTPGFNESQQLLRENMSLEAFSECQTVDKIEEVIKWKLEAQTRKLVSSVDQVESKNQQLSKHIQEVGEECRREFSNLKNLVIQSTTEVLEQVSSEIIPQAEYTT